MKNYLEPKIEFYIVSVDDVIKTSGLVVMLDGSDKDMEVDW